VVNPWGWLPFPFVAPIADFSNVTTTVNMALVSPTTTDSNLSHCCFHNVFETPLPPGFLSLANSVSGGNKDPIPANLGKPTYVMATIISPENCTDGIDNDGDNLIDKDDPDCLICGDGILDSPIEQCDDGNFAPGDGCDQSCQLEGQPRTDFSKEIISGNDEGGVEGAGPDGVIDLAVEVGIENQSMYDFKINYVQPNLPPVQIEDTVPAEWEVKGLEGDSLNCEFASANGKDDGKSATILVCLPEGTEGMVTVLVDARCHEKGNNKCRPTSCGALYLNNGAAAYELDPATDEPMLDVDGNRLPPLLETNSLCLVAVSDLNGNGIDYTGNGDEDGDGLLDHDEACGIGTDPCVDDSDGDGVSDFDEVASGCMNPLNPDTDGDTISDGDEMAAGTDPCDPDTDGDGYDDNEDACPLEGPADPALGEILGEDGCIRQSQCSDGLDNEPDGQTDYPDDQSCDDILDDSEDTVDPALTDCVEANGLT
jgi:cysteine-rich repeat protein